MLLEAGDAYPLGEVLVWEPGHHYAQSFTLAQDPTYPSRLDVTFEVGKHAARAGIITRAHPKLGQITPGVPEDKSRILEVDATVSPPHGRVRHCTKTAEFTDFEPNAVEYKFYCPGIGVTRRRGVRGGTAQTALTRIVNR